MAARPPDLKTTLARVWFPLALIGLLLLAVPGILLFALNLLGKEGPVNAWLEERLRLSYHIPISRWAALVLLLVPLAIVLLYFLKLKRKPLQVPSTFLWKKSIEDLHVNSLFQWLRENVLLLLQVLTVLALIYAVMAFRVHGRTTEGKHYILMIDNSASMAATDVSPSRLEQAKQEALQVIDAQTDSDFGMVIVFNSSAEILQSYTSDRGLLRRAVEKGSVQTQRPARPRTAPSAGIEEALSLAASLANPSRSTENETARPAAEEPGKERTYVNAEGIKTELHLFSDGRFPDVPEFRVGNLDVQYHAIGRPGVENVALVTLSALRDERGPGKLQAFAAIQNFCSQQVRTKVELELLGTDGTLKDLKSKEILLSARQVVEEKEGDKDQPVPHETPGEGTVTFDLKDLDDQAHVVLHATLKNYRVTNPDGQAAEPFRDPFPLDDEAWLVIGVVRKARVLIVGPPNQRLHDFFDQEATEKVARVQYLAPGELKDDKKYRQPAREGTFDLVVFDRCTPEKEADLPLGNTLFIDAVPPPWKKADMPKVENPHIRGWMSKHPLLRDLGGLQDILISEAFRFDLADPRVPPRTPRLLETDRDTAVLFALSRQAFTDVVMTFALMNDKDEWVTNWPKEISFPLFLRNLLYTLGNVSDAAGEENVQPGQVKTLRPDVAVRQVQVLDPDRREETLARGTRADFSYGKTERVGVYDVKWDGGQRSFAVNLFDPEESNLEPREEIHLGSTRIVTGEVHSQPREIWKWVVLAALLLLLLEWYIYNRRIYI